MNSDSDIRSAPFERNRNGKERSSDLLRWGAVVGGGALALLGLSRKSKSGVALAAAGGLLAYRGAILDSAEKQFHAESSFAMACSAEKAFQFWRNFENLPRFMRNLESVKIIDDRRSDWNVIGRFGKPIHWQAEIVDKKPNEWIVWRSLSGSDFDCRGSVYFRELPGGRGIVVTAALQYGPPAGALGKSVGMLLGKDAQFMLREDLRRFKALMEAGEVPNVQGQTHGPRSRLHRAFDLAYPEIRRPSEFEADMEQLQAQRSA